MKLTFIQYLFQRNLIPDSSYNIEQCHKLFTPERVEEFRDQYRAESIVNLRTLTFIPVQMTKEMVLKYKALVFDNNDNLINIVVSNLHDKFKINAIQQVFHKYNNVKFHIGHENDIKYYANNVNFNNERLIQLEDQAIMECGFSELDEDIEFQSPQTSINNMIKEIIYNAIDLKISDIHIEFKNHNHVSIKYRDISSKLYTSYYFPSRLENAIFHDLLIMSGGDIINKDTIQEGSFDIFHNEHSYTMRLSYIPLTNGYSFVLRVGYTSQMLLRLKDIIFHDLIYSQICNIISPKSGLFVVSGKVGSGKTTLLYAVLNDLFSTSNNKIITIEDPIEAKIPILNQVELGKDSKIDHNSILSASLRQDPDVLVVGEIRDKFTAEFVVRAALTGLCIMGTIHSSTPEIAYKRLLNFGIDKVELDLVFKLSIGTVKYPKICKKCRKKVGTVFIESVDKNISYWEGSGCEDCLYTGYKGSFFYQDMYTTNKDGQNKNNKEYLINLVDKGLISIDEIDSY